MGKVGSESIYWSLEKMKIPNPLYHIHILESTRLRNSIRFFNQSNRNLTMQLKHSLEFIRNMDQYSDIKVVTAVREPVSQLVSAFYQNLNEQHLDENGNPNISKITDILKERINKYDVNSSQSNCNWFDVEFKGFFDIDIYELEFNKDLGYQMYSTIGTDILILKLEKSELWQKCLRFFLGMNTFNLERMNDSKNKVYYEAYKKTQNELKFPKEVLEKIYATKFVSYFYTEDEISSFIDKWVIK